MFSKFFKEFDEMSSALFSDQSFSMLLGRPMVFPKTDDPKFVYSKESVDKDSVMTTKETWESSDGTTRFSKIGRAHV